MLTKNASFIVHDEGEGEKIQPGSLVTFHLTTKEICGKVIDSTEERQTPMQVRATDEPPCKNL